MSTHLAVASSEEEKGRNGSVRPSELSLVVEGGSLVPPSPSHTPRNKSPVTVQEWVDSLPLTPTDVTRVEEEGEPRIVLTQDIDDSLTLGAEAGLMCGPLPPAVQVTSCREPSESGSHCSSVESLLEARKPDPEEVLLSLGFGGNHTSECRIPQRFLQPSRLRGVAIDDFLRHQQEVVQNFETGFCGYRGLSGPSHAMPSVIVAKIMEKLREHERESSSVASPPHASINTDKNKFSRVARNVLTKIRCVPGNSVLTPDNRAYLDSQGHKSPEVSRKRIIIGQQSFTFSRDGDLIESQSPPSSITDSDSRWTSSTGTPGLQKPEQTLDKPGFPSIQEDMTEPSLPTHTFHLQPHLNPPRHAFANVVTSLLAEKNQESKLSSSSVEVSDEDKQWSRSLGDSGLPSSGRSSRGLDECDSPVNLSDEKHEPVAQCSAAVDNHLDSIFEDAKPPCESLFSDLKQTARHKDISMDSIVINDNNFELGNETEKLILEGTNFEVNLPLSNEYFVDSNKSDNNNLEIICEKTELNLVNSNSPVSLSETSEHFKGSKETCDNAFEITCEIKKPILENVSEICNASCSLPVSVAHSISPPSEMSTLELPSPWPSLASELESSGMTTREQDDDLLPTYAKKDETNGILLVEPSELPSVLQVSREPSTLVSAPVKVIESLDKVIESLEKIMEPLEVIAESDLQLSSAVRTQTEKNKLLSSYEDLRLLVEQLMEVGMSIDIGTVEHYLSLTVNERCALQCHIVRQALSVYQAQLALDTSHYELKCCLSSEVIKLSDLLDTAADPDKLSTLVQQMTELLKHQAELSRQLREWTRESAQEPHILCEVVLRRLRALELIVHRNTRALSDLRNHI